jgi:hypothetical protein
MFWIFDPFPRKLFVYALEFCGEENLFVKNNLQGMLTTLKFPVFESNS